MISHHIPWMSFLFLDRKHARLAFFFHVSKSPCALSETQNKELPPQRDSFIPGWLDNPGVACMMS